MLPVTFVLFTGLAANASPLHDACVSGDVARVKKLLAGGAKVNSKNKEGSTPLHLAAMNGRKQVAELLIMKGADVNARDKSGATPLILAARQGSKAFTKTLIRNNRRPGMKNHSSQRTNPERALRIPDSNGLCINETKANLRAGPGTGHQKLWQVYLYTPFVKIGKQGDWYRVRDFEGDIYWVINSLVTDAYMCAIVKGSLANIRTGPGKNHPQASWSPVKKFYTMRVLQVSGRWVQVDNGAGGIGWVYRPLIWIQ